jgi:hypothetical protein
LQIKTDKNEVAASFGITVRPLKVISLTRMIKSSKITCLQIKTYKNKVVASFGITVKPLKVKVIKSRFKVTVKSLKVKVIKSRFKVKDHMFAN